MRICLSKYHICVLLFLALINARSIEKKTKAQPTPPPKVTPKDVPAKPSKPSKPVKIEKTEPRRPPTAPEFNLPKSWQERKGAGRRPVIPATGQISGRKPVIPATGQVGSVLPVQGTYPVRTVHYVGIPQTVRTVHRVRGPYLIRGVAPAPKPKVALVAVKTFRDGNVPAMRRFYKMADRNGDGKVTDLEMLKFSRDNFAKYVDMLKVSRALNSVDTNKNGKLSFYEFKVAVKDRLAENNKKPTQTT